MPLNLRDEGVAPPSRQGTKNSIPGSSQSQFLDFMTSHPRIVHKAAYRSWCSSLREEGPRSYGGGLISTVLSSSGGSGSSIPGHA